MKINALKLHNKTWGAITLLGLLMSFFIISFFFVSSCEVGGNTCVNDSDCTPRRCYQSLCVECVTSKDCHSGTFCVLQHCLSRNEIPKDIPTDSFLPNDASTNDYNVNPEEKSPIKDVILKEHITRDNLIIDQIILDKKREKRLHSEEIITEETSQDFSDMGCVVGVIRSCYTGPAKTSGVGVCKSGFQKCTTYEMWGRCEKEIVPSKEICGDKKDNDCNGKTDEKEAGCECTPKEAKPCGISTGECKKGKMTCQDNGKWSICIDSIEPHIEMCDGKDNDCDGKIDEEWSKKGKPCIVGIGECQRKGVFRCHSLKTLLECSVKSATPVDESCDGKDNDCDGQIDENLMRSCYSGAKGTEGKGECKSGSQVCIKGAWGLCKGAILPIKEKCGDNKDNDCDGQIDEKDAGCRCSPGVTKICGSHTGECKTGTMKCSIRSTWGPCVGATVPQPEKCDGKDNDCDGRIDEFLKKRCYTASLRTMGVGLCHAGSSFCRKGGWGICIGQVTPKTEVCDGKDNDCDGKTDEGIKSQPCKTGRQGDCAIGSTSCSLGQIHCVIPKPQPEKCDGKDNDCDGRIDEGTIMGSLMKSCYTGPLKTKGVGLCHGGTSFCRRGVWGICISQVTPKTEICDGKDNDCDGFVDEGIISSKCLTGKKGVCAYGTRRCISGSLFCIGPNPVKESCNKKDDDCDGLTDEGTYGSCRMANGRLGALVCPNGTLVCSDKIPK